MLSYYALVYWMLWVSPAMEMVRMHGAFIWFAVWLFAAMSLLLVTGLCAMIICSGGRDEGGYKLAKNITGKLLYLTGGTAAINGLLLMAV